MTEQNRTLSAKQRAAVAALLVADRQRAAELAGVSRSTLYRWLSDDLFLAELAAAEAAALSDLSRRLVALGQQAAGVLAGVMGDDEVAAGVRVRCADVALSHLLRVHELVDLEARIAALEAASGGGK